MEEQRQTMLQGKGGGEQQQQGDETHRGGTEGCGASSGDGVWDELVCCDSGS